MFITLDFVVSWAPTEFGTCQSRVVRQVTTAILRKEATGHFVTLVEAALPPAHLTLSDLQTGQPDCSDRPLHLLNQHRLLVHHQTDPVILLWALAHPSKRSHSY